MKRGDINQCVFNVGSSTVSCAGPVGGRGFIVPLVYTYNGAFPLQGAERIGSQRCGSDRVSTAKSGRDPDFAVPVPTPF